ncbi:uncharacterized protein Tco025E_09328 [Trypanosoma conorhini]|uniref:Uncharacterized protein n=1 Tax=Trypanosoma conorhini TaxID=83891 RepID=A0A3R7LIP7_9TRYP|nr:uncharacterized protein Tco025E_09328 [Trypanosoma conorhini]RNE97997.1 hypothetical protein Tco025E_09328 [Trypanosoma conorhini]
MCAEHINTREDLHRSSLQRHTHAPPPPRPHAPRLRRSLHPLPPHGGGGNSGALGASSLTLPRAWATQFQSAAPPPLSNATLSSSKMAARTTSAKRGSTPSASVACCADSVTRCACNGAPASIEAPAGAPPLSPSLDEA